MAHALSADRLHIIAGAQHTPMASHPEEFNTILQSVLQRPERDVIENQPDVIEPFAVAECINEAGTLISGRYRIIKVKNCKGLRIVDATADQIVIENSLVNLQNVSVSTSKGAALSVSDSVIVGTNIQLSGEQAVNARHTRLDFAGATLKGSQLLLWSQGKSRVIMSVSKGVLGNQQQYLHGDFQLQDQRLEDVARKTRP